MPPRTRGRGGARGGRGGRGGATAARAGAASPAPVPSEPSGETAITVEETDSKPASLSATPNLDESNISSAVERVAESSARPSVQRLEGLKSAGPTTRSASPAAKRGRKPTVFKPSVTSRRSKEDRDALAKAVNDREKERQAERLAEGKKKGQDKGYQRKKDQGLSAARDGNGGAVSGPFSLGNAVQDRRKEDRITVSGSRATRVKREDLDKEGGAGPSKTSRGAGIKKEDGGYISSEDEEVAHLPRKDIDLIEISSDEDEDEPGPSNRRARARRSEGSSVLLPVRIGRREHLDRVVGINTEASSETAAKILQQAEASGTEVKAEIDDDASRKSKGKAKDVEITGVRRPYKGMWQDANESETRIKVEPLSEDEEMFDAEPVGISKPAVKEPIKPPSSPELRKKRKLRKPGSEPVLQTDEEKAEWARFQTNLRLVRVELGPEEETIVDANGDTIMDDAGEPVTRSFRSGLSYLFQFPTTMPLALRPKSKKGRSEAARLASTAVTNVHQTSNKGGGNKSEQKAEDEKEKKEDSNGLISDPGTAGKVRLHDSGRTTFKWGRAWFEITRGAQAMFMQELVDVDTVEEELRMVPKEGGESTSQGRLQGMFVVAPDLGAMLR